jgi:hypothetical protein
MRTPAIIVPARVCRRADRGWPAAAWRAAAAVTAVTAATALAWGAAPLSAAAAVRPDAIVQTFIYKGAVAQTTTVPAGVFLADVRVIGGKGGSSLGITGGDSAQISGQIVVTPGEVVTVKVAGHGETSKDSAGHGGWGATGYGGAGGTGSHGNADGGGGGGASDLEIGGAVVVIAGGGGGAGGDGLYPYHGGPGGSSGTTVDNGHDGTGLGHGAGGGGAANGVPAGGGGGNGTLYGGGGGGGGAGAVGGGGGGGGKSGGGGGGGGGAGSSRYTERLKSATIIRGNGPDGNGQVDIVWSNGTAPVCFDQIIQVPFDSPRVPGELQCTDTSLVTKFGIARLPAHGTVPAFDPESGKFIYIPDFGYSGPDSLILYAYDGVLKSAYTIVFVVARP